MSNHPPDAAPAPPPSRRPRPGSSSNQPPNRTQATPTALPDPMLPTSASSLEVNPSLACRNPRPIKTNGVICFDRRPGPMHLHWRRANGRSIRNGDMDSLERWEQRQQDRGRGTRPASRPARSAEPRPRPQNVNVSLPARSFGDWIVAGFGIAIGMSLFWLLISVVLFILSLVLGLALLPFF